MFQPQITFTIEMNRNLERIDKIRELINLVPIIPYWEAELQRTALVNTVHYSTKIEGNTLSLENVEKLLSGRKAQGSNKDKQEVANLQRVMEFANEVAMNRDIVLSENLIKQFNTDILRDIPDSRTIGEYRTGQNYIQNKATGEIIFTPPVAWDVPELMHDFVLWFSSGQRGLSPILQAGVGHLELAAIHPFWDGNGRTARALSTFIMYRGGYNLRRLFSWEECVGRNMESYHQAIKASLGDRYGRQYNATPWLEYFTGAIAESLEKLRDKIEKLKQKFNVPGGNYYINLDRFYFDPDSRNNQNSPSYRGLAHKHPGIPLQIKRICRQRWFHPTEYPIYCLCIRVVIPLRKGHN